MAPYSFIQPSLNSQVYIKHLLNHTKNIILINIKLVTNLLN